MAINLFDRNNATDSDITDVSDVSEKKTGAVAGVDINHGRASRLGWLVLAIGFGGFYCGLPGAARPRGAGRWSGGGDG
jgi:hypothetical protein